jgi:tripartite-type tricarboxylate transporter receptor subunit TctC
MARLNEILNAVTDKADFRARLTAQGTEPAGGSIADVARFIQTEKIKWEPMVRASGAKSNQ